MAVHSLKDLPTALEDGPRGGRRAGPRGHPRRAGRTPAGDLRDGCRIGTGAPRRAMQLLRTDAHRHRSADRGGADPRQRGHPARLVRERPGRRRRAGRSRTAPARSPRLRGSTDSERSEADTVVRNLQAQILDHRGHASSPRTGRPRPGNSFVARSTPTRRPCSRRLDDPVARAESLAERGFSAPWRPVARHRSVPERIVKSVRGTSLDLTLAAVIGRTLLSNLSEPTKTGLVVGPSGVLRWEAHGSTDDPAQFGASQAIQVLAELRDPQGPRR